MIECQLCHNMFGQISGKHLKYKHDGMTVGEYKNLFPNHPIHNFPPVTEEAKRKQSEKKLGRRHSQATKDKIGAGNRGKIMSEEATAKWKVSYAEFIALNNGSPQRGYKRNQEFKDRMSEIAKNRSPEYVQQKVDQMLAARRGSTATPEQRERYSNARIKYMQENPDKISPKLFNTRPELEFEKELIAREIRYIKNFNLKNRLFDFKIEDDILIEIDGPFHWNENMYGNRYVPKEEKIQLLALTISKDQFKNKLANDNGYKIYRIKVEGSLPKNWYDQLINQNFDRF